MAIVIENEKIALDMIHDALKFYPSGIREWNLINVLEDRGLPFSKSNLKDPLAMFQTHFLLFHLLYRLRDRLRSTGTTDLEIHCLCIKIIKLAPTSGNALQVADPLASYYLDTTHLIETERDDVEKMINWFWRKMDQREKRKDDLAVLKLEDPVSNEEIKSRFRELARCHHPDKGGDQELFKPIVKAANNLLN